VDVDRVIYFFGGGGDVVRSCGRQTGWFVQNDRRSDGYPTRFIAGGGVDC